jgi:hypothetical protein
MQLGLRYVRYSQVKGTARQPCVADADDAAVDVHHAASSGIAAKIRGSVAGINPGTGINDVPLTVVASPGTDVATIRSSMPFAAASLVWENIWCVSYRAGCSVSAFRCVKAHALL